MGATSGKMRIVVVGGGVAGLSTAYHLGLRKAAGRGVDVVLLEREAALATHSSAKSARIFRTSGGDATTRVLTRASGAFLRRPPPGFGEEPLLDGRGLVLLAGPGGSEALEREIAEADREARNDERSAQPSRRLAPSELAALAPDYRSPYGAETAAWLCRGEGRIDTERMLAGFARGAREAGVEIRTGCAVSSVWIEGGRARGVLLESGSRVDAEVVVLAAGAWAGALGAAAGSAVKLRPTRRHLLQFEPSPGESTGGPVVWDVEAGLYLRPGPEGLVCCICDQDGADPDRLANDPRILASIRARAAEVLAGPPRATRTGWAGLRTLTEDGAFAIGPDPAIGDLFWVAGLGGAGMGAGPEIGRVAADLLLREGAAKSESDELAAALAPGRLAQRGVQSGASSSPPAQARP